MAIPPVLPSIEDSWVDRGRTDQRGGHRPQMGVSKGTVSKSARKAIEAGWLRKNRREYELVV